MYRASTRSGVTLLFVKLEERGRVSRETLLLALRINLFPARNLPIKAKKPATESHVAQESQECVNPSRSVARPPARSRAAFSLCAEASLLPTALGRGWAYSLFFVNKCVSQDPLSRPVRGLGCISHISDKSVKPSPTLAQGGKEKLTHLLTRRRS